MSKIGSKTESQEFSTDSKTPKIAGQQNAGRLSLGYKKLEPRIVLNGDFSFAAGLLSLDDFTQTTDENLVITETADSVIFTLSEGKWDGKDSADASGNNKSALEVLKNSLTDEIQINDSNGGGIGIGLDIEFDTDSFGNAKSLDILGGKNATGELSALKGFAISEISFSNVGKVDFSKGGFDFDRIQGSTLDGPITIVDSDELEISGPLSIQDSGVKADSDIVIKAAGSITVSGEVTNFSTNNGASIEIDAGGTDSDVLINEKIESKGGNVQVSADDSITFGKDGAIVANGSSGDISIVANVDDADGDGTDAIEMDAASSITSTNGEIQLTATGSDAGNIALGSLSTSSSSGQALFIEADGGVTDAGAATNLSAANGGIKLDVSTFGTSTDAIEIDAGKIEFSATDEIHLTDLAGGLTIANASNADAGGSITANSPLTISADVTVGGDFTFTAGNSAADDDDLTINNNATVTLDSATDATLTFNAGDDVILDTGAILTKGGGTHSVVVNADTEGAAGGDTDRGSITNSAAGAAVSITTNNLTLTSSDGIGDSSADAGTFANEALRINADLLTATNADTSKILIDEVDSIAIDLVENTNGNIELVAENDITDGDTGTDDDDFVGVDVTITSTNGNIGSDSFTTIFKDEFDAIEVTATGDLVASATNGIIAISPDVTGTSTFNTDTLILVSNDDLTFTETTPTFNFLALIADADNDGSGTLNLGNSLSVTNDLRVEGADIAAADGTIDLAASRLLFDSEQGETINADVSQVNLIVGGDSSLFSSLTLSVLDLNCDVDTTAIQSGNSDVLIDVTGAILILDEAELGTGTLRLVARGDVIQDGDGLITASALGVRQEGPVFNPAGDINGDTVFGINLGFDNVVDTFAAFNIFDGGSVDFHSTSSLTIDTVAALVDGTAAFAATSGVTATNGRILLASDGSMTIDESVDAGNDIVRLLADGNISQQNNGSISATDLGVRQVGTSGDIDLTLATNAVGVFAAENSADGGLICFANSSDLTVATVTALNIGTISFGNTVGVSSSDGDILIETQGDLTLDDLIDAGTADVRLIGNGDITQDADGLITANELGVRQESATGNIVLCFANNVDTFAAFNMAAGATISFRSTRPLTIGTVSASTHNGVTFDETVGVVSSDGDVFIVGDSSVSIEAQIDAGTASLRLLGNGNITQTASGIITADEVGVRQESGSGTISLGFDNVVNEVAMSNASGDISAFRSTQNLTVGLITSVTDCGTTFMQTIGASSNNGDILISSDVTLFLDEEVNSGTAAVRLVANGDITQDGEGLITANTLGVRQEAASGDILLCENNLVSVAGMTNASAGGQIQFLATGNLEIGTVSAQTEGNAKFGNTVGFVATNGDIYVNSAGLFLNDQVNAGTGDVRILSSDSVSQDDNGLITANELGIRQENAAGSDIRLGFDNAVDEIAFFNAATDRINFNSVRNLTIGEVVAFADACGNSFVATTGVVSSNADILLRSGGSMFLDEQVNAGTGDVRLIGNGDIHQDAEGIITANDLGVRQENATFSATGDLDTNNEFDIHLCFANVVDGNFAAFNAEDSGSVFFNSTAAFTIGTVAAQATPGTSFANTDGITTNNGDIFIDTDSALDLTQSLDAGTGTVRLVTDGDLTQSAAGTITAGNLGVRQESAAGGDILLGDDNAVGIFSAFNAFASGVIAFNSTTNLEIGTTSAFVDPCGRTFTATTGAVTTNGDILIRSGGSLFLNDEVNAGTGIVRLIGNGDITQDADGLITATDLGVIQEDATFDNAGDLNGNGNFDIVLCFANSVSGARFAASNAEAEGTISFRTELGDPVNDTLTVGVIDALTLDGVAFGKTTGITSTDGDVFLVSNGKLSINEALDAGTGDVRLMAANDIVQDADGLITASGLGVIQSNATSVVRLGFDNAIDLVAIDNAGTDTTINSTRNLEVGTVSTLTDCGTTFTTTSGVVTDGSILIGSGGSLFLNEQVNAGSNDVRIVANGDVVQDAEGIITAGLLGVRQENGTFDNAGDLNGNGDFDIELCFDNAVDQIALSNAEARGFISFHSTVDLTVDTVGADADQNVNFAATDGVTSSDGDIFIASDGSLTLNQAVAAGKGDVRLIGNGDITQIATGIISGNQLGVRQEGATGDIILCFDNDINEFAAFNAAAGDEVQINNTGSLTITTVDAATGGSINFDSTDGISTNDGNVFIVADDNLSLLQQVNAGTADVRILNNGSITQTTDGIISANELGIRQANVGANLDINLGFFNNVDEVAILNSSDSGRIVFQSSRSLTIGEVDEFTDACGTKFETTTGVTSQNDDILLSANDANNGTTEDFTISKAINAGTGDVRIIGNGDITQDGTDGLIFANDLGVRQQGASGNIVLCFDNEVSGQFAAFNNAAGGTTSFYSKLAYSIGTVGTQVSGGTSFATTTGISTDGDLFLSSDNALNIGQKIDVGANTVRIVASGDITQDAAGIIVAGGLGVRQENTADGDVLLGDDNEAAIVAISNEFQGGVITFHNRVNTTVGEITAFADPCGRTFDLTTGIVTNKGDILMRVEGAVDLDEQVNAGTLNNVRLISDGSLTQDAEGIITANQLGIRQEGTFGNVDLTFDNVVNELAGSNADDGGTFFFRNTQDLLINEVANQTSDGVTFATTTGITTTNGDVLIDADGKLTINEAIDAGTGDVRLIADGQIEQTADGLITANELGVRQESASGNIVLCFANNVDQFAAFNADSGGTISFRSTRDLTIDTVALQGSLNVTFTETVGVVSTNGEIFIVGDADLTLASEVNAGSSVVRMIGNGNISQNAAGTITANELGIRQLAGTGEIQLGFDNVVNEIALRNESGDDSVFRSLSGITVGSVTSVTDCGVTFDQTDGASSNNGDILIESEGALFIDFAIDAGTSDVYLVAEGQIEQDINGQITADRLGVRQQGIVGDIILCFGNNVNEFAAFNAATGAAINFESVLDLEIGSLPELDPSGDAIFSETIGVTSTDGDIFIDTVKSLTLDDVIVAGDAIVRLVGLGDITQDANGTISARELGVRQESGLAGNIDLSFANAVEEVALNNSNAGGTISFRSTVDLTVGEVDAFVDSCGNIFGSTSGVTTNKGDILIDSDQSLFLDFQVNASNSADVRLISNGDMTQDAQGLIVANELGLRQEGATGDIILCFPNIVDELAAFNAADGGIISFRTTQSLTIETVTTESQLADGTTFTQTVGVTSTNGDIFLAADDGVAASVETFTIDDNIDAGTGDVRIIGNGDITQVAGDVIIANQLGVRQQETSGGIIELAEDGNQVDEFAAVNLSSTSIIAFQSDRDLTIGSLTSFAGGSITFDATTGVTTTNGDVLIESEGSLTLDEFINAGTSDVRLIADGDITQDADGIITANELGVRQENAAGGVISLGVNGNQVDVFAASNAGTGSIIAFQSDRDLIVGTVGAASADATTFTATSGLTSDNGDILIESEGSLTLDDFTNAGTADVRLIADGDISQDATGTITANELGVRQESAAGDINLSFENAIDEFAALNNAAAGTVAIQSTRNLILGELGTQTANDITFGTTSGVVTNDGDLLLESGGSIFIDFKVDVGIADVRLIGNGDIHQDEEGIIVANEVGVRQLATVFDAGANLDGPGNTTFDILLCFDNEVDEFAALNDFDGGFISLRSIGSVTFDAVTAQTIGDITFDATTGVSGLNNSMIFSSDSSLFIDTAINAGTGDVYLIANGDIIQDATGIITADELGVRQNATTFNLAGDFDNNGQFEILLAFDNAVNEIAAFNGEEDGRIVFNNTIATTVGSLDKLVVCGLEFAQTDGIVSSNGDILIDSDSTLTLDFEVNAGAADVRLVARGEITQDAEGIITANELGVRQESAASGDIDLCFANNVDEIAAFNNIDSGEINFRSARDLTVGTVGLRNQNNASFAATTGVISTNGNIFLVSDSADVTGQSLFLSESVNAGTGLVRLIGNGDIRQNAQGIIVADALGVRQESADGDIRLGVDGNLVNSFAASNAGTNNQITFQSDSALTISQVGSFTCEVTFGSTVGVVSNDGDVLIESEGSLSINQAIDAGAADVRLIADGDITQIVTGVITANELGVRQQSNASGNIQLCFANNIDEFAAFNNFTGGEISLRTTRDLTVETVLNTAESSSDTFSDIDFATTTGVVSTNGNIFLVSDSADGGGQSIFLSESVNAGAVIVRLIGNGDIRQDAEGVILADALGVRQESADGDIRLGVDGNQVNTFAAFSAGAGNQITFQSDLALTVGEVGTFTCETTFATTTGVVSNDGDILIESEGSLLLTEQVNAGTADVRLIADSDITQTVSGIITANELGLRQESLTSGNIQLCFANNVDELSALNNFSGGEISFRTTRDLTVETVSNTTESSSDTFSNINFATTTGVVSTNGNIFLVSDSADGSGQSIFLSETVSAGTAIVRLIGNGHIRQDAEGVIVADSLGVRQLATDGDIRLGVDGNLVRTFAASNSGVNNQVTFQSDVALTIGNVGSFTCETTFANTNGVTSDDGDILIESEGSLTIIRAVNAGVADVRLIADGDITQTTVGLITANELGVRQESAASGNIQLCFANEVDEFSAFNNFDSGEISFRTTRDLTVETVDNTAESTPDTFSDINFLTTTGVVSTNGNVFLVADSADGAGQSMFLSETVNAGSAIVRLIGNGHIRQDAEGVIVADSLGVRQQGADGDIRLGIDGNQVSNFAASNSGVNNQITFQSDIDLNIGSVGSFTCETTFNTTTGVVSSDGNILIESEGSLTLSEAVNAGVADVRLIADGDVTQTVTGIITANELGVRQESTAGGNIQLCFANNVDEFSASNVNRDGEISFRTTRDLTIETVLNTTESTPDTFSDINFTTTDGITSNNGDVFLVADSADKLSGNTIFISESIQTFAGGATDASDKVGTATVRMIGNGNILQDAQGIIVANKLGIRQESGDGFIRLATDGFDDGNAATRDGNLVNLFASTNSGANSQTSFQSDLNLTIDEVSSVTCGPQVFADVLGVTTSDGDILIESEGYLRLLEDVTAGAADVRFVADGDINQIQTALVTANEFGARIDSTTFDANNDQDGNGQFDITLCFDNVVDIFAAANNQNGNISFRSVSDLTIGQIGARTIQGASFAATTGITTDGGDLFLSGDQDISITESIDVGAGTFRLIGLGDIVQTASGTITADTLGVRQNNSAANLEIRLGFDNDVNNFAALNASTDAEIVFRSVTSFTVEDVAFARDCSVSFAAISGVVTSNGNVLLEANDDNAATTEDMTIASRISVGTADVRLVGNGDILQSDDGRITANELGVRQNNATGNVELCLANQVDVFSAQNAAAGGRISFRSARDLTIERLESSSVQNADFNETVGIITNNGEVLIDSDQSLTIEEQINAGDSTVRLLGREDITQTKTGTIVANELAVRQQAGGAGFDILLGFDNEVSEFAADNRSTGGDVVLRSTESLTIGRVTRVSPTGDCGIEFAQTDGVVTNEGDVLIESTGITGGDSLTLDFEINTGGNTADVHLVGNGNIQQDANGLITTNQLGVVQNRVGGGDIVLCFANDVDMFTSQNNGAGSNTSFRSTQDLTIGTIDSYQYPAGSINIPQTASFNGISGITTSNGDLFLVSDGSLDINDGISAPDSTVRLMANGNINQDIDGTIVSKSLGVRQESTQNGLDINLGFANQVSIFAANNASQNGEVNFQSTLAMTIDQIAQANECGSNFELTTGIETNNGDVLVVGGDDLTIQRNVNAGSANVRLAANGDITQNQNGIITADTLGVRQLDATAGNNIQLCFLNNVDQFSSVNDSSTGTISFRSQRDLTIGELSKFDNGTKGFATFDAVDGVQGTADVFLHSNMSMTINNEIIADNSALRILSRGTVSQANSGTITASELAVRQENGTNADILLAESNNVDQFAAFNNASGGEINFLSTQDLTVASTAAFTDCNSVFATTIGVVSTGQNSGNGDILIESNKSLSLVNQINTNTTTGTVGAADVRLVAQGAITQTTNGLVTATTLGVNQNAAAGEISLGFENRVDEFVADNQGVGEDITFQTTNDLLIQSLDGLATQDASLAKTVGITSNNGDILVESNASIQIEQEISVGANGINKADVRLVGTDSINQTAAGTITANQLAVRQQSPAGGNITLGFDNTVDEFVAFNNGTKSTIAFRTTEDLTINQVATAGKTGDFAEFIETTGVKSANGNVVLDSDGTIDIEQAIFTSGAANRSGDVRLIGNGDIQQSAAGIITTNELGVRQQNSNNGIIRLCEGNSIDEFSASNAASNADISIRSLDNLTIEQLGVFAGQNINFANTVGVVSNVGEISIQTPLDLTIERTVSAVGSVVSIDAGGEIKQSASGQISTRDFAIRSAGDLDLNGTANRISRLAASVGGDFSFSNSRDLVITELGLKDPCNGAGTIETITGLNVGGDLSLEVNGDITQSKSVIVGSEASFFATGDIEVNDLVDVEKSLLLRAGEGSTNQGRIKIDSVIDVEQQTLLQAGKGIVQGTTGQILTDHLLLGSQDNTIPRSGDVILGSANNQVGQISADLKDDLFFVNDTNLEITSGTFEQRFLLNSGSTKAPSFAFDGLETDDSLKFVIDGNLTDADRSITDIENIALIELTGNNLSHNVILGDGADAQVFFGHESKDRSEFLSVEADNLSLEIDNNVASGNIGVNLSGLTQNADASTNIDTSSRSGELIGFTIADTLFIRSADGSLGAAVEQLDDTSTNGTGHIQARNAAFVLNDAWIHLTDTRVDNFAADVNVNDTLDPTERVEILKSLIAGRNTTFGGNGAIDGAAAEIDSALVSQANLLFANFVESNNIPFDGLLIPLTGSNQVASGAANLNDPRIAQFLTNGFLETNVFEALAEPEFAVLVESNEALSGNQLTIGEISGFNGFTDVVAGLRVNMQSNSEFGNVQIIESTGDVILSGDRGNAGVAAQINNGMLTIQSQNGDLRLINQAEIQRFDNGVEVGVVKGDVNGDVRPVLTIGDNTTTQVTDAKEQIFDLKFGKSGERNFFVSVIYADQLFDVAHFDGAEQGSEFFRLSRSYEYTLQFLQQNGQNLNTLVTIHNDPLINLFDRSGDLSINNLNEFSSLQLASPFADLNNVSQLIGVNTQGVPTPITTLREVVPLEVVAANDELIVPLEPTTPFETQGGDFEGATGSVENQAQVFVVLLEGDGDESDAAENKFELEFAPNEIDEIVEKVQNDPQYPPGVYHIKVRIGSGKETFRYEFVKEPLADPDDELGFNASESTESLVGIHSDYDPDAVSTEKVWQENWESLNPSEGSLSEVAALGEEAIIADQDQDNTTNRYNEDDSPVSIIDETDAGNNFINSEKSDSDDDSSKTAQRKSRFAGASMLAGAILMGTTQSQTNSNDGKAKSVNENADPIPAEESRDYSKRGRRRRKLRDLAKFL